MITQQDTAFAENVFEDAIASTVYMATVHVREGEMALPERIRTHLADGPVIVHLMRGEDDVAVHEATLTSRSTLTGITWPADVKPRTTLTVLCPRGGASHDIGVLLPQVNVDWPDDDLPDKPKPEPTPKPEQDDEPVCTCTPSHCDFDDHDNPYTGDECVPCGQQPDGSRCIAREGDYTPVTDEQLAAITGALTAMADAAVPAAETALPGPADYEVPTDLPVTGELALPEQEQDWPGAGDLAAGETTEVLTAVLAPAAPDPTVNVEPGTVFSAAVVAVRSQALLARQQPPRRAGWLERRVREAARLVLAESHTATRVVLAVASFLVLAGTGVGFLLAEVAR